MARSYEKRTPALGRRFLAELGLSVVVVGVTTLMVGLLLSHWQINLSLLYLFGILWLAATRGRAAALLASAEAFLAYDWFFVVPFHTFNVDQPQEWLSLSIFLVVALVTGQAYARQKRNVLVIAEHDRHTQLLYDLSTRLTAEENLGDLFQEMLQGLAQGLDLAGVRLYVFRDGVRELAAAIEPARMQGVAPLRCVPCKIGETELADLEVLEKQGVAGLTEDDLRVLKGFANQLANALERRRLEKEEKLNRLLEEANRAKSSLLAAVSHDLRTPLAAIKASATSLLQAEPSWEESVRREFALSINHEADRVDRLVTNLLDMSRIESGALAPRLEWHNLAEIAADVIDRLQPVSGGHELCLVAEDEEVLCHVDYVQMSQVITNLVDNAIRHGAAGTPIRVRVFDCHIAVENSGRHLSAEECTRIFEPFYRGSDAVSGTGLGLAIARGVVEAHGGHIWVENVPDGLVFHCALACSDSPQQPSESEPHTRPQTSSVQPGL